MVYDISMDVFRLVTESFSQLFIQASGLEVWNLEDGIRNTQEVVFWNMSGQLFSFHSISFNNHSNFLPFTCVDIVVLVHVLYAVCQSADCLLLFFSLCSQKFAKHVCFDRLLSVLVTEGITPSVSEFS